MKNLLAISWSLPPLLYPRSIQVSRLLNHLRKVGWESTVITLDPQDAPNQASIDPSFLKVHHPQYQSILVRYNYNTFYKRIFWRLFPISKMLPDEHRFWSHKAMSRAIELLQIGKYSAIVSFAQPWSDHFAGLNIHRATGIPWIAHFSDPWVDSPYYHGNNRHLKNIWTRMEQDIIREANAVIFVTQQTADLVMAKYPSSWQRKVCVIPHSYDPEIMSVIGSSKMPSKSKLKITYTGNFYGNRTPNNLLISIKALIDSGYNLEEKVEFKFIGQPIQPFQRFAEELNLSKIVTFCGPKSYMESLQAAGSSDILLVIDAPTDCGSVFLPSKLIDYLVFQKPIFGLTPNSGASADLLRSLDCPIAEPDNPSQIASALLMLIVLWEEGRLSISNKFGDVSKKYLIDNVISSYNNIFLKVIK